MHKRGCEGKKNFFYVKIGQKSRGASDSGTEWKCMGKARGRSKNQLFVSTK